MTHCWAVTKELRRCKNPRNKGSLFCHKHQRWTWLTHRLTLATVVTTFIVIIAFLADFTGFLQNIGISPLLIKTPTVPAPPASRKLYYMTVVDASERMLDSIQGSQQKWQVANRSLQDKISLLPSGANFGLVTFGQQDSSKPPPCEESAKVLVPVNDLAISEKPMVGISQQRALSATAGLKPGGKGSLTKAISLAVNQLMSDLPEDYSKTIIVVTGGGDECNPGAEWDSLEFLLSGTVRQLNVYTELIVLITEEVKDEVIAKVNKISRLDKVSVSLPTTPQELSEDLGDAVDRAVQRGMQVDPTPFVVQETIVAATQVSQSGNTSPTIQVDQPDVPAPIEASPFQPPPNTIAVFPSPTPFVTWTSMPTRSPTSISPTRTFTPLPPTNTRTSIPPSQTFTSVPPSQTSTNILPTSEPPTPIPPTMVPTIFIPPSPTPTFGAALWNALPSQVDVFSVGCPLINRSRLFAQFYQGQAAISSTLTSNGHTNQGLRLDFSNVSAEGGNYAGWEVWLGDSDQTGIDLSKYSSLVVYIRGNVGGENPNIYLMMPGIDDYQRFWKAVESVAPVTTSWSKVEIPLSDFTLGQGAHEHVVLTSIQKIQIVFEWSPQPTSGRVFIDDLCVQ